MTSFAQSGDVRIAYETRGDGAPLALVHGVAYDRVGWGRLPELLAGHYRVVLIDNRGVGESALPPGPYTVPELAADVVAVLDDAGIERTHLLGVSLGGYIAQEVALAYPERVEKLVLCSAAPGGGQAVPMPAQTVRLFEEFPTLPREVGLRRFVENSLGERGVRERPELVDEILRYRLEHAPPVEGFLAQSAAGATYVNSDRVSRIAAPTLVLQGDGDVVVDPRNAEVLGGLIPDARVVVVPGRGHLMVWEDSERVAELVTEFLA